MDTDVTPPTPARIAETLADRPSSAGSGRLIAITGTEPELGISSFCLALGEGFAHAGSATLIIDANPERGGLQERLEATQISQVSAERLPDEFADLTIPRDLYPFLGRTSQGAHVLGSDDERPLALSNEQLGDLIRRALAHWETLIIDCGPRYAGRVDALTGAAELLTLAPTRFKGTADGILVRTGSAHWPHDRRMARRKPVVWTGLGRGTRDGVLQLIDLIRAGGSSDLQPTVELDPIAADEWREVERILAEPQSPWRRRARMALTVAPVVMLLGVGAAASQNLPVFGSPAGSERVAEQASAPRRGAEIPPRAVTPAAEPPKPRTTRAAPPVPKKTKRSKPVSPQPTRRASAGSAPATPSPTVSRPAPVVSAPTPTRTGSAAAEFSP